MSRAWPLDLGVPGADHSGLALRRSVVVRSMSEDPAPLSALAMLLPVTAGGQAPPAAVGARVRVTAPSHDLERETTTIMDVRGDSIVVGDRHAARVIALMDVTTLEVSTGKRRRVLRDTGFGLGIGVVAAWSSAPSRTKSVCRRDLQVA